ncbi:MAG: hypothetical protein R3F65_27985 [bacterium]
MSAAIDLTRHDVDPHAPDGLAPTARPPSHLALTFATPADVTRFARALTGLLGGAGARVVATTTRGTLRADLSTEEIARDLERNRPPRCASTRPPEAPQPRSRSPRSPPTPRP